MICWYSDGAASAVALKLMVDECHAVRAIKAETNSEHPDNERFRRDVEAWTGQSIEVLHNEKYRDVDECVEKTGFLRGPKGARCTVELKKRVRFSVGALDETHVFGYTADTKDEKRAANLLKANPEYTMRFPLIEQGLTKADCLGIIREAGIAIPAMYLLGYQNNNCLGCLKAESPGYWLSTKANFPEVFQRRAAQERKLGYALCRVNGSPVYLDELEHHMTTRFDVPGQLKIESLSCDFLCGGEAAGYDVIPRD